MTRSMLISNNYNIKKSYILIMMLEEYIYDVSDDDRLSQRCRSFENEKKLKFITKIEYHIWRIAVQVNDFFWSYKLSSLQ